MDTDSDGISALIHDVSLRLKLLDTQDVTPAQRDENLKDMCAQLNKKLHITLCNGPADVASWEPERRMKVKCLKHYLALLTGSATVPDVRYFRRMRQGSFRSFVDPNEVESAVSGLRGEAWRRLW